MKDSFSINHVVKNKPCLNLLNDKKRSALKDTSKNFSVQYVLTECHQETLFPKS